MAASWYLAPSLSELRSEINQRWPARSKSSDGTIGDAAHSSRASDHNPNGRRSVNAIDVTNAGIDEEFLIRRCIADYRTNYAISKKRIFSRSRGFVARAYFGPNPHNIHVHVSILQNRTAEDSRSSWGIASSGGSVSAGAGTTTSPGLPSTGADPTPTQPEEDTLSAADVADLKAFIKTTIQDQHNASNELLGGRAKLNQIGQTAADYVSKTGFDRVIIERNAEAAARQTAAIMDGRIAALSTLLEDIRREGKLTTEAVGKLDKSAADAAGKAAGENARKGITEGLSEVTATWDAALREILGELLFDTGKESGDDIIERVMAELAARVAPEAVAK